MINGLRAVITAMMSKMNCTALQLLALLVTAATALAVSLKTAVIFLFFFLNSCPLLYPQCCWLALVKMLVKGSHV